MESLEVTGSQTRPGKYNCLCAHTLPGPSFLLCLLTFTFPSAGHLLTFIVSQKKGDRSSPLIYQPITLTCLSKTFESICSWRIFKHLSSNNLLSDRQYGFCKGQFTSVFFPLTESCLVFPSGFDETFVVALD